MINHSAPLAKRPFYLRLNKLDFILLFFLGCVCFALYERAAMGVQYQWEWEKAIQLVFTPRANGDLPYFFQGVIATLRLSLWGIIVALILGFLLGFARYFSWPFFRVIATLYVQLIRNIPPLVFVFIFYFFIANQVIPALGLTSVLREHPGDINVLQALLFGPVRLWENLLSGVLCVGLLSAAYVSETVRSGLENIPKGQWEAAKSLGLSPRVRFIKVILPQVITVIAPILAGQTISLVKDSSIVSLISIQELTFVGSEMANSSGFVFEIWLLVGAVYFLLCTGLSLLFRFMEKTSHKHNLK